MPADFQSPLTLAAPAQFAGLRQLFLKHGYSTGAVCEHEKIETIFDFNVQRPETDEPKPFSDAIDALVRVLMHGQLTREEDWLAFFSGRDLECFEALGVLARVPGHDCFLYATAALYPVENVYAASDRTFPPLRSLNTPVPADVVFAAITRHTRVFLGSIPRDACENLLDVCAGSGIAAIVAAADFAKRSCAADLGVRCVHFSEFSRRLNGLENMSTAAGDLYDAVPGQQFDRIVAHPPYIPNKDTELLFRDGGEDGEQVFSRTVQGLPQMLAAGGRFHCVTFATDRQSGELEDRIRAWLGPDESDFDVVLVASDLRKRPDNVIGALGKGPQKLELGESGKTLERLGVTRLFYGSVMVQRKAARRKAFTARTFRSPKSPLSVAEEYRELSTALYEQDMATVADRRPRLASDFRLVVTHRPGPEGLTPSQYSLGLTYPWVTDAKTEPWIAVLLSLCDGQRTIRELYEQLARDGVMSTETTPDEFWALMRILALNGYVEFDGRNSVLPASSQTDG